MSGARVTSYIGGAIADHGGSEIELLNPQTGTSTVRIVETGAADIARAVMDARETFATARLWPLHRRSELLRAAAEALTGDAERVAALISEDVGKPIRVARVEVRRAVEFIHACASAALTIGGEVLPLDSVPNGVGHFGFTRSVPFGVVGAITPFNAPANLLIQKVAPAIAAGNSVVVKPALSGTRAALAMADLFHKAGWPAGLFNVVTGDREAALALAADDGVDVVSFTGGTLAGQALVRAAGIKKFVAELGSNAANIVMADADIDDAAKKIAAAGFEASGQQCISAQRVLVERSVFYEFVEKFAAAASRIKVGPASDPTTDIGPMVHRAAADRVMEMCRDAVERGGRYALEPRQDGCTVSPGILVDLSFEARLWREEVFGPIAVVVPFESVDEALRLANDSPFGLQGAVFTKSISTAMRFSSDFDVGSLWINEASRFRLDMYPFGGMKQSGTGREGVRYAIEELSQIKFTGMLL